MNHLSDKGLIFTIFEVLLQVNNKKINSLIKIWVKDLNQPLSREDIQMANEHMKRCSASLANGRNGNQNHTEILLHTC